MRFEEQFNSVSQELDEATRKLKLTEGELFNKTVECDAKKNSVSYSHFGSSDQPPALKTSNCGLPRLALNKGWPRLLVVNSGPTLDHSRSTEAWI